MTNKLKIVYCTPALYMPGGVERVLCTEVNWLAEHTAYDIYIILTDGYGKEPYYPISEKVKIINLNLNYEQLWFLPFLKKAFVYTKLQRKYKKALSKTLIDISPDITISLLRREINFLSSINDGSKKIGWLHVNRMNYRNFEPNEQTFTKKIFSKYWSHNLLKKLKKLDSFVVLSNEDKQNWKELHNTTVIYNPQPDLPYKQSCLDNKKVLAIGRYVFQKGFDLLLKAWCNVHQQHPDWTLTIYGDGNRNYYKDLKDKYNLGDSVLLNGAVTNITDKYAESSIFVLSSRFEGFGMVLIEAMASGVPCISFACPCGPSDIITNNVDGLLVQAEDTDELTRRICELIENKDLLFKLSRNGMKSVNRFNIDSIMNKWVELFNSVVK